MRPCSGFTPVLLLFTLENLTQLNKLTLKMRQKRAKLGPNQRQVSLPSLFLRQTEEPFPPHLFCSPFPRGRSALNAELLSDVGMLNAGSFGCDLWPRSDGRA